MSTKDFLQKSPTTILILLFTVFTVFLTGCTSGPSQAVSSADSLVKAFITANEAKDTKQYVSLFSEDGVFMCHATPSFRWTGPMRVQNIQVLIAQTLNDPSFSMKFESYFVSSDGASAALQGTYTNKNSKAELVSVPLVMILQIKDGKVVRQDNYYDYTPFE